jgi:hypothetical protein
VLLFVNDPALWKKITFNKTSSGQFYGYLRMVNDNVKPLTISVSAKKPIFLTLYGVDKNEYGYFQYRKTVPHTCC